MIFTIALIAIVSSTFLSVIKRFYQVTSNFNLNASIFIPLFCGAIYGVINSLSPLDSLICSVVCWLVSSGFYDRVSRWVRPAIDLAVGQGNV
jgi:uncharacterized membrane protein (GlpM family)